MDILDTWKMTIFPFGWDNTLQLTGLSEKYLHFIRNLCLEPCPPEPAASIANYVAIQVESYLGFIWETS